MENRTKNLKKNFLRQNWFKGGVLAVAILGLALFFYWHEWRPAQAKKECFNTVKELGVSNLEDLNAFFDLCLKRKGV